MKKIIFVIVTIVLISVGSILLYLNFKEEKGINLEGHQVSLLLNQVDNQKAINARLNKISSSKKYTLSNPYYELNPYKISPLSAIIIFSTDDDVPVDLYVNDVYVTRVESAKDHVIPVYGLYEDFENKIKLVTDIGESEVVIKTEKSNIEYPLNVKYASNSLNNQDMYFTVASYKTYLTGWDIEGKLRFYLTVDNRMDVEWLDNGHFLIGTSQGQFAENFVSFVEMDYLGKIYNYYVPSNGYSFEFQNLSDNSIMLAGGNNPVYIDEQVIYTIDPNDGKTIDLINLSSIILDIDPEFNKIYLGQKAIRNAFYYNETTDELLVSFRGLDAVLSYNFKAKSLNWIFTDPNNEAFQSEVWKDYLVTTKNGRYPMGEHSVIFTSDGNIAFFNNGYDRLHGFENGGNDSVSFYKNNYSSVDIFNINGNNAKLVWSYDDNKSMFSHQYGSVNETNLGYLMNFGYNLKDDYRASESGLLSEAELSPEHIYSRIIEVDKNKNVIFDATCEEGKFRAFKHNLYNETTSNTILYKLNIFNNLESDRLTKKQSSDINLDEAQEWIYSFELTENTLTTNYQIAESDDIDLYFVNKKGEIYILNYKDRDNSKLKRIFNLNLSDDVYRVYVSLNDNLFKIDTIYVEKH
ncbi:MAG: aryl-sulfate sulfotransferase [Bacilli bacterium]|nr:aryl-sulfate sulfotransferase [Bacilli bacterium]